LYFVVTAGTAVAAGASGAVVGSAGASGAAVGSAVAAPPHATIAALAAPIAEYRKNLRRCSFALMDFPPWYALVFTEGRIHANLEPSRNCSTFAEKVEIRMTYLTAS
jgi:hypothetical protein